MSAVCVQVVLRNLGRMCFKEAWELQVKASRTILDALRMNKTSSDGHFENTLFLVEHNPVYTIGIRTSSYTKQEEDKLKALGADFVQTNRGGLITFHGPGQLVAYPVLYLGDFDPKRSMKSYICKLERTVIHMCNFYGIQAHTSPHTGVWVGDNKIAAIGVHGSRYVTTHGVAINCNVDLSWFDHIVPCGIENKGVTSLTKELGYQVTINDAVPHFIKAFEDQFGCRVISKAPKQAVKEV